MNQIHYLVVDLFCGAGGTTIDFEQSGVAKVIAAVNHDPCPTIVAMQDKAPLYLIDTQYGNIGQSTEEPCKTITADRHWKYLMQCEGGQVAIPVYESNSEVVVRIKHFMAMYGIVDIKMRMLKVIELKRIQGFPEEYELLGNQDDQKKFIGNSVCPVVVKCWVLAMAGVESEAMAV